MKIWKLEISFEEILEALGAWIALTCFFILPPYLGFLAVIDAFARDNETVFMIGTGIFTAISLFFLIGFIALPIIEAFHGNSKTKSTDKQSPEQ